MGRAVQSLPGVERRVSTPVYFGVRHLSPAGAWHLRRLLDGKRPKLVLIEGPSDMTAQMHHIANPESVPPIAMMAYTRELPVRTILYPLAEYSPEYQAIVWAAKNRVESRFIDLPAGTFLALQSVQAEGRSASGSVYEKLDQLSGEDDHETFWEHIIEHSCREDAYLRGAREFGIQLRNLTEGADGDYAENIIREAFMKREIQRAIAEGFAPADIVVVTGSYHVQGLMSDTPPMSDDELKNLPMLEAEQTLMPYSYYRLSSRSGYGAGNKAPAYYGLLWEGLNAGDLGQVTYSYLARIAAWQRNYGNPVSAAEVIEASRLAAELARIHGYEIPSLRDLRDAATTCMGHGSFSEIAMAVADTEIGTHIGALPDGVSRTSIQQDFYRLLRDLRLEKYKSMVAETLSLDLREKLTVKSEKSANIDLERSFFLHRLRVLDIHFGQLGVNKQDRATWAEEWQLRWAPEVEIEIVESALRGDTVVQAASFALKERLDSPESGIAEAAKVIEDAFLCGMPEAVAYATGALQRLAVDAAAIHDIAVTANRLSGVLRYGSIRKLDPAPLEPVLGQLFLRGCLLMENSCLCDDNAVRPIIAAMDHLNTVTLHHDFLDTEQWLAVLRRIADRDDLNPKASGFAAAILLERGEFSDSQLETQVQKRLSSGVPADLGASWFEGLSLKNRYALIARLTLWRKLGEYLDTLDDEEFKRALVFLRRAFADFTAREKSDIAENLGEVWGVNKEQASEIINSPVTGEEKQLLDSLNDFDFDDI